MVRAKDGAMGEVVVKRFGQTILGRGWIGALAVNDGSSTDPGACLGL
jgi:hypothetical protein